MNTNISAFIPSDKMETMTAKKRRSEHISRLYKAIGEEKKSKVVFDCGTYRLYGVKADGRARLVEANFCHLRMCPQCAWLLARKRAVDLFKCLAEPEHKDKRFIFLTLTVRNCTADELSETLDRMYNGLRSWTSQKNSFLRKRTVGLIKKLEVTYNRKSNTYHPHFHIFCEVDESYFSDPKLYIENKTLAEKWADTLELDYYPQCKVQAVKKGDTKGVLETAKYSAKDDDYGYSVDVFRVFDSSLKGRRLYTPLGSFKETMKRLKMNPDDFEDSRKNNVEVPNNPDILRFALVWNAGAKCYKVRIEKKNDVAGILAGVAILEDIEC